MERSVLLGGVVLAGMALLLVGAAGALPADEEGFPRAEAGLDQTVERDSAVLLDATESFDPDGEIVAYDWAITAPDGSALAPDCDVSSCRLASFRAAQLGEYAVTLTVTDDDGRERSDTMYVRTVVPGDFGVELTASGSRGDRTLTARVAPGRYDVDSLAWYHEGTLIEREDVPVFGGVFTRDVAPDPGDRYRVVATAESGRTVADSWVAPSAGSGSGGDGGGDGGTGGIGGGGSGGGVGSGGGEGTGDGGGGAGSGDDPGIGNGTDGGGGEPGGGGGDDGGEAGNQTDDGSTEDGNVTDSDPTCSENPSATDTDCVDGGGDDEGDEDIGVSNRYPRIVGPSLVTGSHDPDQFEGWLNRDEEYTVQTGRWSTASNPIWTIFGSNTPNSWNGHGVSNSPPLSPGENRIVADLDLESRIQDMQWQEALNGTERRELIARTSGETTVERNVTWDPAPSVRIVQFDTLSDRMRIQYEVIDPYNPVQRLYILVDDETQELVYDPIHSNTRTTYLEIPEDMRGSTTIELFVRDRGEQTAMVSESVFYSSSIDETEAGGIDVADMPSDDSNAGGTAPVAGGSMGYP